MLKLVRAQMARHAWLMAGLVAAGVVATAQCYGRTVQLTGQIFGVGLDLDRSWLGWWLIAAALLSAVPTFSDRRPGAVAARGATARDWGVRIGAALARLVLAAALPLAATLVLSRGAQWLQLTQYAVAMLAVACIGLLASSVTRRWYLAAALALPAIGGYVWVLDWLSRTVSPHYAHAVLGPIAVLLVVAPGCLWGSYLLVSRPATAGWRRCGAAAAGWAGMTAAGLAVSAGLHWLWLSHRLGG